MKRTLILSTVALLACGQMFPQDEPQIKITPSGRLLIDGALFASPQKDQWPDGMAIPEARLGVKMAYGKWSSAIDVSYAYNKVGLRNLWIEYGFNKNNSLRIGNFIHQYGLQATSPSLKCTMEQPVASALYTPGLQLGAMFVHYSPNFYAAASAHVESSALKEMMNAPLFNQQGYGLLTRLLWRNAPQYDTPIIQAGISGGFATPQRHVVDSEDIHEGFTMSATYPTKVVQLEAIGTTVSNSKNLFKFTPELLATYKNIAFEGQYFYQCINRRQDLSAYTSQSGYATLRTLVIGGNYGYVSSTGQLARPKSGAVECVFNYNYATLSDRHAGIFGGRANNFNATVNYYINPYITARLNYTFTHTWGREGYDPMTLNGFQARLMLLF